jgi:hypothetical protein
MSSSTTWIESGDPTMPLLVVETGQLRLVFLPAVGGRLISLVAEGRERLWRNAEYLDQGLLVQRPRATWPPIVDTVSWPNLGGAKTWLAPQSRWEGPPDAVLDSGHYATAVSATETATIITLTSEDDTRSGVRIIREFEVPHGGLGIEQRTIVHNHSQSVVDWAAWEVVQVPFPPGSIIEVESDAQLPVDLGRHVGIPAVDRVDVGWRVVARPAVGKLGFPGARGLVRLNGVLELSIEIDEAGGYSDQCSPIQVWQQHPVAAPIPALDGMRPDAWLAELEVLSPVKRLEPGDDLQLAVGWTVLPAASAPGSSPRRRINR